MLSILDYYVMQTALPVAAATYLPAGTLFSRQHAENGNDVPYKPAPALVTYHGNMEAVGAVMAASKGTLKQGESKDGHDVGISPVLSEN
jgi:hypothetical protein